MVLGVPQDTEGALTALEVGAGGVKEQQVDLEVQQVCAGEEDGLLDLGLRVGVDEQIHRAVGMVLVHRLKTGDVHVGRGPLGGGQLRARVQRAVGDQREQHPLDVRAEPPGAEHSVG